MEQELKRRVQFFNEQYWYASAFLKNYLPFHDYRNLNLLEMGSAEGGCLKFFNEEGSNCYGIEIAKNRVAFSRIHNRKNLHLLLGDICDDVLYRQLPKMDMIILRDVIEHIHQKELALKNIKMILKKEGIVFISFPPKYSPYAGHQQNIKNVIGRLPFIHLFPEFVYSKILELIRVKPFQINRLLEAKRNTISIRNMERLFIQKGFEVLKKDLYLIRPCFEKRFGIKPKKIFLNRCPLLREFFTLGALYLLKNNSNNSYLHGNESS
ncbi:class I SAM-dependent methyltransferase [bacterium]|nr:class I SAM-dependent methyltransferase [bacterium]